MICQLLLILSKLHKTTYRIFYQRYHILHFAFWIIHSYSIYLPHLYFVTFSHFVQVFKKFTHLRFLCFTKHWQAMPPLSHHPPTPQEPLYIHPKTSLLEHPRYFCTFGTFVLLYFCTSIHQLLSWSLPGAFVHASTQFPGRSTDTALWEELYYILHCVSNHVIYIVHSSGPIELQNLRSALHFTFLCETYLQFYLNDWAAAQYSVYNVPCDVCISCTVYRLYEYDGVC